jgi:hypothetical protein
MSQQAAAGQGAGQGGGRKPKFIPQGGGVESLSKAFRSSTSGIEKWTFNTEQNRRRYGALKDTLANNYLLGSDQYPETF